MGEGWGEGSEANANHPQTLTLTLPKGEGTGKVQTGNILYKRLIDGTGRPPTDDSVIVIQDGQPLPTHFVSKNELTATLAPEAIPSAGTYIVTLTCEGEPLPASNRAHLGVGFKQ